MALNRDFIGRVIPGDDTFEVGIELIRRFADAIGDTNPISHDRAAAQAAGYADVVAPPTFLMTIGSRFSHLAVTHDPDLNLDYGRVVHGEQAFHLTRPVVAGDVLTMSQHVDDVRDAGVNELIAITTTVLDDQGELVATLVQSVISRGTAGT